jgi:hypothetical protein
MNIEQNQVIHRLCVGDKAEPYQSFTVPNSCHSTEVFFTLETVNFGGIVQRTRTVHIGDKETFTIMLGIKYNSKEHISIQINLMGLATSPNSFVLPGAFL